MNLPPDVVTYVRAHFSADEWDAVTATLLAACIHTGAFPEERLLRCAAIASGGDLLKLQYYVGLLAIDWRDVIIAGEYALQEQGLTRMRNLYIWIPRGRLTPDVISDRWPISSCRRS